MDFVPDGQGITGARYLAMMRSLRNAIHRRRPALRHQNWLLHHDSALAHHSRMVQRFFQNTGTTMHPHPLLTRHCTHGLLVV